MAELVAEARVELYVSHEHSWMPVKDQSGTAPAAVEMGRRCWADEREAEVIDGTAAPVRVIDSAGVVVVQWGRP
jgi:hypothetical protein